MKTPTSSEKFKQEFSGVEKKRVGPPSVPGESERRLYPIIDRMDIPTFVIDTNHVVIDWNRACEQLTGISAAEIVGTRDTWKAFYTEKRPVLADLVVDSASEKIVCRYYEGKYSKSEFVENSYTVQEFFPQLGTDGKWLLFNATSVRDDEGKVVGAIETFQDITEHQKAEEALRQSEERARQQRAAITDMALEKPSNPIDVTRSFEKACKLLAETIDVARTSVWLLSDDGLALRCATLYEADKGAFSDGVILDAKDFPEYFEAIQAESRLSCEDAQNDPRTRKMAARYLEPLGISSMLDAGIIVGGKLVGVVCTEHIGKFRKWTSDEESFINIMAAFVAQRIAESERRKAEKALQESQQTLESIIRNIPDIIFRLDTEGRITFISESVKAYGYAPSEMIGKSILDYVHPEDREKAFDKINERRSGRRRTSSLEIRLRNKHSENRHFEVKSGVMEPAHVFLFDAERLYEADKVQTEHFIGTQGIARDITERKQAEEELHEKAALLKAAGRIAKVGGWSADLVTGTTTWTDELAIIHGEKPGYSPPIDEASRFIAPEWRARVLSAFGKCIETGAELEEEFEIVTAEGERIWVRANGEAVRNASGEVVQIRGALQDITAQKHSEHSLKESELRYRSLFESANDAIFILKANKFYDCNAKTLEVFGCKRGQIIGKYPYDFSPEFQPDGASSKDKALEVIDGAVKGNFEFFQWRHCRYDGSLFDAEVSLTRFDINGEPHVLVLIRDITEKLETEKKIKAMENQLAQSQKMEAIGTLAGGIAHDFNNILSAVLGYTDLLKMSLPDDTKEFDYTAQIYQAGNRAKELVNQILAFSRQTKHELKPVEIEIILKEVIKLLRSSLPSTIEIKQSIQGRSLIMGDPTRIHQILMNLCTNAAHAMQEKGGTLSIELKTIELSEVLVSHKITLKPGTYVQLCVSDTGHGIPPELRDRVFDPFFSTKERGQGTGMGLSVVHGIVESYKGAVSVSSERGNGSTFKILLPAIERRTEPERVKTIAIPTGTEHILFVDDEPAVVEMGTTQLEYLGYTVSSLTSSVEALALFKNTSDRFDLVITDMTMPKMTGDELAREMKRIRPDVPVVLCTGFSSKIVLKDVPHPNIDAFLMKPVLIEKMAKTVRKLLDQ